MRLPKIALVAAACALTTLTVRAQVRPVTILGGAETVTAVGGGGTLSAIENTVYNPAGGGTIAITPGETLTIFSEYATTVDAAFIELGDTAAADLQITDGIVFKTDAVTGLATGGNVVKTGGGILQVNSWTGMSGTQRTGIWWRDANGDLGYVYPMTANSWFTGAVIAEAPDLQPSIADDPDGRNASRLNGLQGTFTIDQGTVRLAGFLNVWHDQGDNDTVDPLGPLPPPPRYTVESVAQDPLLSPRMTGVAAIVLNGSSVLELTNSPLNIPTGVSNNVSQGNALRVQYLRNLKAGEGNDQLQTELVVGTTPEYRAVIHIDQGQSGSIGIISGAGRVFKTGAGDFTILNEFRLTGAITVGGGRLILDSPEGRALASAASVNLAGIPDPDNRFLTSGFTNLSRNGAHVRYLEQQDIDVTNDGIPDSLYKPAYAPAPGTRVLTQSDGGAWTETVTGAQLDIRGDQTLRNFQSDFALRAAPDETGTIASAIRQAADVSDRGELIIAGTGVGASVFLGGHTLTIRQDKGRDGVYQGSILAGFEYAAVLGDEGAGSYTLAFDRTPGFGTFQLRVTDAAGISRLTDATNIASADEIQANVAAALGVSADAVTVSDATLELDAALGWRIDVGDAGSVDDAANLNAGRLVLDATSDEAKLALILPVGGATFAETEVRRGSLVINAQGLGTSRINVSSGELRIYQTDTASLEASLLGAGTVRLVASALVDNGSGTPIEINSSDDVGTLNFAQQQLGFRGELIVNDGIDVSLSATAGEVTDTLLNARAITLDSGDGERGSTLRFNGTDQVVRNLSGDARSRIELERGTMTLVQEDSSRTFLGQITGVGSVIKRGAGSFNLRGVNDLGVGASDFTGALAVQQGAITLGSANAIRNVSALALASGSTVTAANRNQRIGALFGEAGSTFDIGSATLTVGVTPGRQADLRQQLQTSFGLQTTLSHNYLGTSDAAYDFLTYTFGGDRFTLTPADLDRGPLRIDAATEDDFLDGTLGMADQTRLYLERVLFRFDRNGDGAVSDSEAALANTTAGTLGFAGRLVARGSNQSVAFGGDSALARVSLSKTGWEALRLLNDATGAQGNDFGGGVLVVRQGVLEATTNALATAGSIVVLANSGTIDLDGDGVSEAVDLDGDTVADGVDLNADGVFDELDRAADGTLSLFADAGADVTFGIVIAGDGNLAKTGAGRLVLAPTTTSGAEVAQYTGLTSVLGGELELTLRRAFVDPDDTTATLGGVFIDTGAVLSLRTDSAGSGAGTDFTYVADEGIVGDGTLRKFGRGVLSVSGDRLLVFGGTLADDLGDPLATLGLDVREGTLRITDIADDDTLPAFGFLGRAGVSSGATLQLDLLAGADAELLTELSGSGTFLRTGAGSLTLSSDGAFAAGALAGSLGFTGTVDLAGGETILADAGSFANANVRVRNAGTVLRLAEGAFQFAGLTGEVGTEFALDADTVLTIDVTTTAGAPQPRLDTFLGRFTGAGDLVKTGDGILALSPGLVPNELADITVEAGTLRATVEGIGNGAATSIEVLSGATLQFDVAEGEDETYVAAITGAGSIGKFGAGRILLAGTATLATGVISVAQGTLAVDDTRVGSVIPEASVDAGATFEVVLSGNRTLESQVTGAGNLVLSGSFEATFLNAPSFGGYLGLIEGADVEFNGALTTITLGGLQAAVGSSVTLAAGQTLALSQTATTDFNGQFLGDGDLVIKSASAEENVFRYLTDGGDLSSLNGTVTVDGGALQVGRENTKAITLVNGGDLHINVLSPDEGEYLGDITIDSGTSFLVKVGEGTLDLTGGLDLTSGAGTFGGLVIREGKALVSVADGALLGGGQISLAGTGSIAVDVDYIPELEEDGITPTGLEADGDESPDGIPGFTLIQQVATDGTAGGQFEKLGAGTLVLKAGTATADVLVTAGTLQLGISGAPSAIGGSVTVSPLGTFTGAGSIAGDLSVAAGSTVAPGFSPGTFTVAGDFSNAGTLVMELAASANDSVLFSGTAQLNAGGTARLEIARYGTGALFGRRNILFADTSGSLADSFKGVPLPIPPAPPIDRTLLRFDRDQVVSTDTTPLRVLLVYPTYLQAGRDEVIGNPDDPEDLDSADNASDPRRGLAVDGQVAAYVVRAPSDYDNLLPTTSAALRNAIKAATQVDLTPVTGGSRSDLAPTFTAFGARLAVLDDAALRLAIGNITASGNAAVLSGAAAGFRSHADTLQRRLEQRRFDGADMSVKNHDWFVDAIQGQLDLDNGHEARGTGATAGLIRPMGVDGYWAVTLGVENLKADGGPSSYKGNGFRLGGALGVMNVDRTLALDAGISLGSLGGDLSRPSLAGGNNVTDPKATTLGLWVRGSAAVAVGNIALTPFVTLEHSQTSMDGTQETNPGDLGDSLTVKDVDHTQTAARAGFGLHRSWVSDGGDWRYRLGLEVAYAMQIDGDDATLVSSHAQLGGGEVSSTFNVLPGDGFSVSPTFTFGPSPDSTFTVGLRLEQGSEGEATSLQLGYRRKF